MSLPATDLAHKSPTRVRFGVLGFACSLSLLTYLDRVCIMRAQQDIQGDLDLTKTQMGWVFSAFLFGYALFEVPGGWLGDRWGSRRVIAGIVLWWSAFTALSGSVPGFASWSGGIYLFGSFLSSGLLLMLTVRFLFGLGEAGAFPNLARVVGAWFPYGERAFAQGGIWMTARLGGAIAPFLFGRLMGLGGWRAAFWTLGAVGVAWAVIFYFWYRDTPEEQASCNDAERELIRAGPYSMKADEAGAGHSFPPWRRLVLNPNIWAMCVASAGVSFGWYFYPTWQPQFLEDRFQISFENSEIITGLPFLCGAAGCFVGGGLSDWLIRRTGSRRWGRSLLGLLGFIGAGACVLGTGWAANGWQAVTLLCLAFFINDLAIPVIWAVCTDVGGRYAGTVAGIMNMAGGVGSVVSPILIPELREHIQARLSMVQAWQAIFAILAAAWFIAGLAWLRIDASEPIEPAKEENKLAEMKQQFDALEEARPAAPAESIQRAEDL
jgi:MFS family permease